VEEKIKKAFDAANFMTVLAAQKKILREEYYQSLVYYQNGGVFSVNKELINFTKTLIDLNNHGDVVLIDDNDTPILIEDLKKFLDNILSMYSSATNSYYNKISELRRNRTIEKIIDL